jgi:pimeloyl-ACP methyl ester carboxylesterase
LRSRPDGPPGQARTLIVTHGYGDSAATWNSVARSLRPRFDVRLWDLPGHGQRRGEPADFSRTSAEAELRETVAVAEAPRALIGHSAGGYLTLRVALQTPGLAAALVLIGTGPGFRSKDGMADWNRQMARLAAASTMPSASAALVEMHDSLVIDHLERIEVPVLVIAGTQDRPEYVKGARYLADHIPGASLRMLESAGHDPHRSHPADLARAIAEFLAPALLAARRAGTRRCRNFRSTHYTATTIISDGLGSWSSRWLGGSHGLGALCAADLADFLPRTAGRP